ncbi:MAG TPA: hypothetical protein GXX36_12230 [Clostridiaceae bacterium]|nr:hypothetical protein [Clostridiaceae bacterium]
MWKFFTRPVRKPKLDIGVLRKNDIVLLPLDGRWNNLFKNTEKTTDILRCEERIKELLKQQSSLIAELEEIQVRKKQCMENIIKLTPEAFDKNSEEAKRQMQWCEKEIKRINERKREIEVNLDNIPGLIKEANLELLEYTIKLVYVKIRSNQKRVEELDRLIEETRVRLKEYISERELLAQDGADTYSYFHDLLGSEELEKLDRIFFGKSKG